jgi:NADH-quinone oxidoreductase subunit A
MMAMYAPVFLVLLVAAFLAASFWTAATVLGRHNVHSAERDAPFECGSDSTGARHARVSVKFYMTAMLFVVFDVESIFVYPWAVHLRTLGWLGLAEMFSFLGTIIVALVYVWKKGALEWET